MVFSLLYIVLAIGDWLFASPDKPVIFSGCKIEALRSHRCLNYLKAVFHFRSVDFDSVVVW